MLLRDITPSIVADAYVDRDQAQKNSENQSAIQRLFQIDSAIPIFHKMVTKFASVVSSFLFFKKFKI